MTLRITRRAQRHLDEIADYIQERNPDAARRVGERIREVIALVGEIPLLGREGALPGTREMVVPGLPYVIVYRIEDGAVAVLGVYHGAQQRPGQRKR
jgi:toxin ParE1/3/4